MIIPLVKVKLALCFLLKTEHHAIKAYRGMEI
jgi:hypothetical protein